MPPLIPNERTAGQAAMVSRTRVLLVDEDLRDLEYYRAILLEQGYEVRPFSSYAEAESCLGNEIFDFIVVGQGSCVFEGRRVLERALEIDRRTPVLVLARCLDMGCYLEAMQLGAVDYLEKPLSPSEMARAVATHLRPRSLAA